MNNVDLPSQSLTWNLKMMVSKRNLLFQGAIFRFHVKFWEAMLKKPHPALKWQTNKFSKNKTGLGGKDCLMNSET